MQPSPRWSGADRSHPEVVGSAPIMLCELLSHAVVDFVTLECGLRAPEQVLNALLSGRMATRLRRSSRQRSRSDKKPYSRCLFE